MTAALETEHLFCRYGTTKDVVAARRGVRAPCREQEVLDGELTTLLKVDKLVLPPVR